MAKAPTNKGSLLSRILATSTIDDTDVLNDSVFFEPKDAIHTGVVLVDVALSGLVDGGLYPGLTLFAGKSKSFKTAFSLLCAAAFLKKNPDGVILFYDSEFGTPQSYFDTFGIDRSRVVHTPITNIEILKHDVVNQLTALERGDKVMVIIDSIGNLASKKETDDAVEGKTVADMSRAKAIKSLFRMVTPHLMMKNIPMIAINHTYDTMEMFSKQVVSGGTGSYYSADTIWIITRSQETEGSGASKELMGYNFTINIEKSRFVREKSKLPITVLFEGGINKWSGLFDLAIDEGWLQKIGNSYAPSIGGGKLDPDAAFDKNKRSDLENNSEFWMMMLQSGFKKLIEQKYLLIKDKE